MQKRTIRRALRKVGHVLGVVAGAIGLTLLFFLVLPILQAIQDRGEQKETLNLPAPGVQEPPPPPPPEEEPEDEPEEEEKQLELSQDDAPLDLNELNLALSDGFGTGFGSGAGFARRLSSLGSGDGGDDEPISFRDLDQKPRAVYQANPVLSARAKKKTPGTVYILFSVDERGRVQNPVVQSSTDPVFERPALAAIKKWKFEPGKKDGKPVSFRMRVPITFPKS